jgi:hypothetical protein
MKKREFYFLCKTALLMLVVLFASWNLMAQQKSPLTINPAASCEITLVSDLQPGANLLKVDVYVKSTCTDPYYVDYYAGDFPYGNGQYRIEFSSAIKNASPNAVIRTKILSYTTYPSDLTNASQLPSAISQPNMTAGATLTTTIAAKTPVFNSETPSLIWSADDPLNVTGFGTRICTIGLFSRDTVNHVNLPFSDASANLVLSLANPGTNVTWLDSDDQVFQCNPTVLVNTNLDNYPLTVGFDVLSSQSFCQAGAGSAALQLSGSESGVSYQLYRNTTAVGGTITGTGAALPLGTWTSTTSPGYKYTVKALKGSSAEVPMNTTAVLIHASAVPANPGAITAGLAGNIPAGTQTVKYSIGSVPTGALTCTWTYSGTGVTITPSSVPNIVYLSFAPSASSGALSVVGTNACGNSVTPATKSITVTSALPAPYAITPVGGSSYCEGGLGVIVGVASSQVGVAYQLYKNGSVQGSSVAGTGSAVNFGYQLFGTYTVKGSNANGFTWMTPDPAGIIITQNPLPLPTASSNSPLTVGGTLNLLGGPAGMTTYSWTGPNGFSSLLQNPSISNVTIAAAGTYSLSVTNSNGCTSSPLATTDVTFGTDWIGVTSSSWTDPSNWSYGVPLAGGNATISPATHLPEISTAVSLDVLAINTGATLTINPTGKLTVSSSLSSNAQANSLVIKSGGSLITNGTVTGMATVESTITPGEWHLISSPVAAATANTFLHKYLQTYTESHSLETTGYTDVWEATDMLTPMKGFAAFSFSAFTAEYIGTLNTGSKGNAGNVTRSASGNSYGWNLVGNPYPSSIDWDATSGWTKTHVNSATYIHVNSATWASYVGGSGVNGGSRFIAPGQGFFVQVTEGFTSGTLLMGNSIRIHNATPFYKSETSNFVRLQLTGNNYSDEAIVRILPEATTEFDADFDAVKLFGDVAEAAQLYSLGGSELAINALPQTNPVPVGMRVGVGGRYTIAATEINDLDYVILEDTKTGSFTDLKSGSHSFEFEAGENEQRFVLHFDQQPLNSNDLVIYSNRSTVYVNLANALNGDIYIYNVAGQLVTSANGVKGLNTFELINTGNYIVKVVSPETTLVKKVWIQ